MKRIILAALIASLLLSAMGCSFYQYENWQTINIENCGSLMIPNEWIYYVENNMIYITDKDTNPIFIQTYSYAGIDDNDPGKEESNKYFESIINLKTLSSAVLSNGAVYGKTRISKDTQEYEKYFLDIRHDTYVQLIAWDDKIDIEVLKKIANSYIEIGVLEK